ncbi:hypothetical protein [Maridesulfovibrio sp.]|uniref:hypothetical protein n=1 Tax=Maridesulfovibrio sp. TaxID=2795000 RepID=UPI0039EFCAE5
MMRRTVALTHIICVCVVLFFFDVGLCNQVSYFEKTILLHKRNCILSRNYEIHSKCDPYKFNVRIGVCREFKNDSYSNESAEIYPVTVDEISSKLLSDIDFNNRSVCYLTPGLVDNPLSKFGVLQCQFKLGEVSNINKVIDCNYWEIKSKNTLSELFSNPHTTFIRLVLDNYKCTESFEFNIGGYQYKNNNYRPASCGFEKALIVGYADKVMSTSVENEVRYSESEIVIVNSIYSLLRAISVQKCLNNFKFKTKTYFLSDIFSSAEISDLEARGKERRVEVYYFSGEFVTVGLLHRCAKMLKNNLHDMDDSWYEKILVQMTRNKTEAEKEIIKDEFWNAVAILREVIKAKDIKPLEELLDTDDLANYRKKRNIQRAQTGYASVY